MKNYPNSQPNQMFKLLLLIVFFSFINFSSCAEALVIAKDKPQNSLSDQALDEKLQRIMSKHGLVGLGYAIANSKEKVKTIVKGYRKIGGNEQVATDDAWHLGSNTKALTALLFSRLVTEGIASWEQKIPEYFPEFAENIDPVWQELDIRDLFSHRSGLGRLGPLWILPTRLSDKSVTDLRREDAEDFLTEPPEHEIGNFKYSNLNYIIAGAAIEALLKKRFNKTVSWETAMQTYIFDVVPNSKAKLKWGFGPPEHIEGHRNTMFGFGDLEPVGKGSKADNPSSLGPAGTLHGTLAAHALLVAEFLKVDKQFLPTKQRNILWAPYPNEKSDYALGWRVKNDEKLGAIYSHNGSNNMWLSYALVAPMLDTVIIINTNRSGKKILKDFEHFARDILINNE